jgi:cytochrome b involved in lipid metabolism
MANAIFTSSLLDTFGGLPVHPLAVHGAVVLLPLSALALTLLIFVPKWRKSFFPLTLIGLGLSTLFTYIAKESGEALGERVGEPQTHEALGTILFPASVGLLALGVAFYFLQRTERPKWQVQTAAGLALAGIISVSGLTYFVGHSGAEATWASRIAPIETPTAETTPSAKPTSEVGGITLTEIATHASRTDCWTAIDQTVYDLTGYIQQHPGGAGALENLCGIDATSAYKSQHGGQQRPASALAGLAIGVYAGDVAPTDPTAAPTTEPSATPTSPSAQPGTYTATEVAKHNTGTDCWSVVNSNVYDLTPYVASHPGGASVIKAICGKDGTAAFSGQHGGAATPTSVLAGFKLGALSTAAAAGTAGTLPQASVPAGEGEEGEEDDDD